MTAAGRNALLASEIDAGNRYVYDTSRNLPTTGWEQLRGHMAERRCPHGNDTGRRI